MIQFYLFQLYLIFFPNYSLGNIKKHKYQLILAIHIFHHIYVYKPNILLKTYFLSVSTVNIKSNIKQNHEILELKSYI